MEKLHQPLRLGLEMSDERLPRVLIPAGGQLLPEVMITLDASESSHLIGSLRRRVDDRIVVIDGCGSWATATIVKTAKKKCEVIVGDVFTDEPNLRSVAVALSVLHTQAMDWAVQKCVEVGVTTFVPVTTQRTQVGRRAAQGRLGHWRRIALQALKQCGRTWAMEVQEPMTLETLVGERRGCANLLAIKGGEDLAVAEIHQNTLLMVGPEGGFSGPEDVLLEAEGWKRVRLGDHVLRADTAAVIGGALLSICSR